MDEISYLKNVNVGFIGGGNMASAIGAGLIRKGILNPDNCWVSGRTDRTHGFWSLLGAHPTLKNEEVVSNCHIIFLAKISQFVSLPRIIRSMPNTPMMIGEGITVYCSKDTTPEDLKIIDTLFSYIGISQSVPENLMDAVSGLSGSGPAFAYLIIEALSDGAVRMGVPRPMATKFAAQVLVGAGKMVLETERHPGQLKDEVCSPGGITIAGVHAMENGGVRGSMMNAVQAAVNKIKELNPTY